MVKGVNKTVIEVNNTGSKVFDRIVFYVTAQYGNLSAKELLKATENFTFQFDKRSGRGYKRLRRRMMRKRILTVAGITIAAAAVLTLAAVLIKYCFY
ncbi:MAG: hypothetical protein J6T73_06645 [Clostridia bacterium]|nr:hypothetical protein [Clostridia bacterium]